MSWLQKQKRPSSYELGRLFLSIDHGLLSPSCSLFTTAYAAGTRTGLLDATRQSGLPPTGIALLSHHDPRLLLRYLEGLLPDTSRCLLDLEGLTPSFRIRHLRFVIDGLEKLASESKTRRRVLLINTTAKKSRNQVLTYVSVRKEVIQPQVPLRLPCYDLVPVTGPAVAPLGAFQALPASMT